MSVEDSLVQVGLAVGDVIGGLVGGYQLTISNERRKEREELDKIKELIR